MTARPEPGRPPPAVDQRLVMPETRYEVIDGRVEYVSPSDQPHASRHSKLSALLEAHVAPGYDAASDMLTRTSELGDMAPDGSVYPLAPDPVTGGRRLEELAFEVLSSERLGEAAIKAGRLSGRGVRRIFALDVARRRALEWDPPTRGWRLLPDDAMIEDPALAIGLPVHALVSAANADDAVARALLAKRNAVLAEALDGARGEGRGEGRAEGRAEAVLAVLLGRGLPVSEPLRARILATRDPAVLDRWLAAVGTCVSADELAG